VSELTKCNWCTQQAIIRRYGEQNIKMEADNEGWVNIYHFVGTEPITEMDYSVPRRNWELCASFMVLTTTCVC
jgi:hypothetical protein